ITSQTRLTRTNNDDAHYQISGTITNYDPTLTVGVSGNQSSTNRLNVTVHIVLRKEGRLQDEIIRNLTDEIFNRIFSNW
ncbi:MAG: hypothetical protein EAZ62_09070, partial [Sphingobacteriia bacterium]